MNIEFSRPPIVIASADHERLVALAVSMQDREPGAAALLEELARASIVGEPEAGSAAGFNNRVDFDFDGSVYRDVQLVYPRDADFAKGRLSVLSSVGAMLIGLSKGQTIQWSAADGRDHQLTVLSVLSIA